MDYSKHYSKLVTPQSKRIPGSDQVQNNAGGWVFKTDPWTRLRRFLILGSEGGTYYQNEHNLTIENAQCVEECLKLDGEGTVDIIVDISINARAPKNDPALFAFALACANEKVSGYALNFLPFVCRTGTHLFQFLTMSKNMRGWGRGFRNSVAMWYTEKDLNLLCLQLVKYRQRDGWTHRDVLRKCHAKTSDPIRNQAFKYAVSGKLEGEVPQELKLLYGHEETQNATVERTVANVKEFRLPRESVPTEMLNEPEVWMALSGNMPTIATVRNLGKMTSLGLLKPLSKNSMFEHVMDKLSEESVRASKIHPIQILLAHATYAQGRGFRGSLKWEPNQKVLEALDDAFVYSFPNVEPSGKSTLVALDVSGSMGMSMMNSPLSARQAVAAMACIIVRTEPNVHVIGFSNGTRDGRWYGGRGNYEPMTLNIGRKTSLSEAIKMTSQLPFSGTDCALPMLYADKHKLKVESFQIFTDNETWAGNIHPKQALDIYRKQSGLDAKCVVWGVSSTDFSIADPGDPGMMDVVGFDASAPVIVNAFLRGEI